MSRALREVLKVAPFVCVALVVVRVTPFQDVGILVVGALGVGTLHALNALAVTFLLVEGRPSLLGIFMIGLMMIITTSIVSLLILQQASKAAYPLSAAAVNGVTNPAPLLILGSLAQQHERFAGKPTMSRPARTSELIIERENTAPVDSETAEHSRHAWSNGRMSLRSRRSIGMGGGIR